MGRRLQALPVGREAKLADHCRPGDDRGVTALWALWTALPLHTIAGTARLAVRWLSLHTGLPALVVAAVLVVVGYRILKKSARLMVEIAVVAALLVAATSAGWIRW